jgi:DNA-binding NtrC family response regulator
MNPTSATRRRILSVASHVRCLILDDDYAVCELLTDFLDDHLPGANVQAASTAAEALEALEHSPYDIMFMDLGLPDADGRELISRIIDHQPDLTVIAITGDAHIEDAVTMFRQGAYDFITKPLDLSKVGLSVDRAIDRLQLERENQILRSSQAERSQVPGMVGTSMQMAEINRQIRLIASRDTSVLVLGESGTGKELVARAIHDLSPRAKGPFVAVNVAAIPETLLEAEFFGYGKNSGVSGAPAAGRPGMFEAASGGTLFLDEIGDMPLGAQAKVLRALQEREVVRMVPIDIRVVCATHQDLDAAVADRSFREDLFFRLNSFPIMITPLRERPDDVAVLAQHFLDEFCRSEPAGSTRKVFAPDAIKLLQEMSWPGNVRELKSRVERLAITTTSDVIRAHDIDQRSRTTSRAADVTATLMGGEISDFESATNEFERAYLMRLLESTSFNVTHAAERASLSRTYIHRLMKKHDIVRPPRNRS